MKSTCVALTLFFLITTLSDGQDDKLPSIVDKPAITKSRFEELVRHYKSLEERYYNYKPAHGEDSHERFLKSDPRNVMVEEFLTLERRSRGTRAGFSCLYHLVSAAGSVGDADCPATMGKAKALKILGLHYLDYPDVDTIFRRLFGGATIPEVKEFLRKAISLSPLEHVRANASYELAKYLALEANYPAMVATHLAVIDRKAPEKKATLEYLKRYSAELKNVSIERNRAESRTLLKKIKSDFKGQLFPPPVTTRTPSIIEVHRNNSGAKLKKTGERIVDRLSSIYFELNHSIGQRPPAIDGNDAMGMPMSLSDYHGHVIVLMFSFKGCKPCEAMYPDNRRLINELSEEKFVFLGVQCDKTLATVKETINSGEITWRVWWDGDNKRISKHWNIRGWPSTIVIDKKGIIRFRELRGKDLETAIGLLLKE